MAPAIPNDDPSSLSPQTSPSASNLQRKVAEDLKAWCAAQQTNPPRRERVQRPSGDGRVGHRGPIRITAQDGVLTEYGMELERERRAKLAADENGAGEGVEGSS